jgi:hypothetical protein
MFLKGMKNLILGMKKLTFANFCFHTLGGRFHTLGYEKMAVFS